MVKNEERRQWLARGLKKMGRKSFCPPVLLAILAAGGALRILYLLSAKGQIDADGAIYGLMGMHIAQGRESPVFMYGQNYLGALPAYLIAGGFLLLGVSAESLKLTPIAFSLASVILAYYSAENFFGRDSGIYSALLLAVPPPILLELSLSPRGFIEGFFFAALIVYLFARAWARGAITQRFASLFGFAAGISIWTYQTIIIYLIMLGVILRARLKNLHGRHLSFFLVFFLIGASPLIAANIQSRGATLRDLGGKYLGISGEAYRSGGLLYAIAEGTSAQAAKLALLPGNLSEALLWKLEGFSFAMALGFGAVFAFYLYIFAQAAKDLVKTLARRPTANLCPSSIAGWMAALIFATIAIGFFRSRYLILCYFFLALLAGGFFAGLPRKIKALILILPLILAFNLHGGSALLAGAKNAPVPGLVRHLEALGIARGYSDYYVAYPVAFLSKEKIILSPIAGPVSLDRYPHYTEIVRSADSIAYILREGEGAEDFLLTRLSALGAKYKRSRSGPFVIFYEISGDAARKIELPLKFSGARGKVDG